MEAPAIAHIALLFIPLILGVGVGVTLLLMRVVRLARFPGFGVRFDSWFGFVPRWLQLLGWLFALGFALVPALVGVSLLLPERATELEPPRQQRPPPDGAAPQATATPQAPAASGAPPPIKRDRAAVTAVPSRPDASEAPTAPEAYRDLVPLDIDEHGYRHTRQITPEQVREGNWPEAIDSVDVLFVHAHPDDESLDFALLMAALARSGLRIATLLLTDGESGLDRYPRRSEHPGYESRLLSGEALREVRIQETQRALSVLGSDYYIRLALPNHRYNSLADVLPLPELLNSWGGEAALVQTLLDILSRLRPRLVVAPDLPSQAREHFEHEATGYLVRQAVQRATHKGIAPQGYLVSVDPFQKQFYPSAVAVPRSPRWQDLRRVQRAALSQHHTQADASVIGIRRLADLPSEYYLPLFWHLPESLGSLIGAREAILARE